MWLRMVAAYRLHRACTAYVQEHKQQQVSAHRGPLQQAVIPLLSLLT